MATPKHAQLFKVWMVAVVWDKSYFRWYRKEAVHSSAPLPSSSTLCASRERDLGLPTRPGKAPWQLQRYSGAHSGWTLISSRSYTYLYVFLLTHICACENVASKTIVLLNKVFSSLSNKRNFTSFESLKSDFSPKILPYSWVFTATKKRHFQNISSKH